MAEKKGKIIVLKIKFEVPAINNSGIIVVFINIEDKVLSNIYSVTVSGNELFEKDIKQKVADIMYEIALHKENYTIYHEIDDKVKAGLKTIFDSQIIEQTINAIVKKDVGYIDNLFKRNLLSILSEDKIDLKFSVEQINKSILSYIQTIETIDNMTFAQKVEIAKNFNDDNKEIAEKVVKDNVRDAVLIKVRMENSAYKIAGIIFLNEFQKKIKKCLFVVTKNNIENLPTTLNFIDFISVINDLENESDSSIANELCAIVNTLVIDTIFSVIKNDDNKISHFFKAAFTKFSNDIKVSCSKEKMNSMLLHGIVDFSDPSKKENNYDNQKNSQKFKTVEIKLVLSPTKGKNLSKIVQNEKVFIVPDKETIGGKKMISQLKLDDNGRLKQVVAPVYSVTRDSQNGFDVLVKLGGDLYGKTYEEQDMKVKYVSVVDDQVAKKSPIPIILGLLAGIFVITITIIGIAIAVL